MGDHQHQHRDLHPSHHPAHFNTHHHHYYGYRVHHLPSYRIIHHWGYDYYLYDGIYYRYYGGYYHICRPPFGTLISSAVADAVIFSYYFNTFNTYSTIFENYQTIAEQNRIIAENNAKIAAQQNLKVSSTYDLASSLGLVQSYAYADQQYFYQDGVFYILENNQYKVIIPPAGALISTLPEDYETITLNNQIFYKVDQTVYRTVIHNGQPYLEVLGQLYN